jgi:hypothetical protein
MTPENSELIPYNSLESGLHGTFSLAHCDRLQDNSNNAMLLMYLNI